MAEQPAWMTSKAVDQGDDIYYDPGTGKYYGYMQGRYKKKRGWKSSKYYNIDDMVELTKDELEAYKEYRGEGNKGTYRGKSGMGAYKGPGKARMSSRKDDEGMESDYAFKKGLMGLSERWDRETLYGDRGQARKSMMENRRSVMSQMRDRYKRGGGWGSL